VTHIRGPLLEETHYYPFGLTMNGISSKALSFGDPKNKKLFNDKELNTDLGLDWYEYGFRNNYDPQIGRFCSVDPIASDYPYYTPFQFAGNEVPNKIDIDGLEPGPPPSAAYAMNKELYDDLVQGKNTPRVRNSAKAGAVVVFLITLFTPGPDEVVVGAVLGKATRLAKVADKAEDAKKLVDKVDDVKDVKKVPNPNGKKGGPEHQKKMDEVADDLKKEGYDQVKKEVKVETPGGTKDKRYVDVQGTNSTTGQTKQVQVGKQNKNGTPVSREKKALDDIEKSTGKRPEFIPYN